MRRRGGGGCREEGSILQREWGKVGGEERGDGQRECEER